MLKHIMHLGAKTERAGQVLVARIIFRYLHIVLEDIDGNKEGCKINRAFV